MLDFIKLLKIMKFELWKKEESLNFENVEGKVAENKRINLKRIPIDHKIVLLKTTHQT